MAYFHTTRYTYYMNTELNKTDELLDLVDQNDCVIRQEWRSVIHANQLKYLRAINAFIVNDEGKLWIPRRAAHKPSLANALDMSVSGHVQSGENYEQAFIRELAEEVNMDAHTIAYRCLGYLTPVRDDTSAFMKVYEITHHKTPNYNTDDFSECFWLSPQEILDQLEAGALAKSDLKKLVHRFYKNSL
jgi:isopentenyl-diphosphate delta-isomerase